MRNQRRWTQEELDRTAVGKTRSKGRYGNVSKPVHDGIRFDSKREMLRYMDLRLLEKAGEICGLKVHPRFKIIIGGVSVLFKTKRYPNGRQMVYVADFSYFPGRSEGMQLGLVVEDVKMESGFRTEVYKIKRALMDAMGYTITET